MTPALKLMHAYLRRATERNLELQRQNKNLRTAVAQLKASREKWKAKALARGDTARRRRGEIRRQYERAELWKHRALREEDDR